MQHIEYYATSNNLQDKEFSHQLQSTFNYTHSVMQIRYDVEAFKVQSLDTIYSLEAHQYLGKQRNKQQYLVLQLKHNTELLP